MFNKLCSDNLILKNNMINVYTLHTFSVNNIVYIVYVDKNEIISLNIILRKIEFIWKSIIIKIFVTKLYIFTIFSYRISIVTLKLLLLIC